MKRYVLSPEAAHDLSLIKSRLLNDAGVKMTRQVMHRFRDIFAMLANEPGLGHFRDDLADRNVKFWSVYSYLVIYAPESRPIEIVRILHSSRNIESILAD